MRHANTSGFAAMLHLTTNREGRETAVAIVRATFDVEPDGQLKPADEQVPVRLEDVHLGNPGQSTILEECDLAVYKPGTDVIVVGEAHAPDGRLVTVLPVAVRVGRLQKAAWITGERFYHPAFGIGLLTASEPAPFRTVPLVWERTFGGVDAAASGDSPPKRDSRNPLGCGFGARVRGQRLPQIAPLQGEGGPGDTDLPWGFAPLGRSWAPRACFAGTFDAAWRAQRLPFLPVDFDYRFFQAGADGLVSEGHLRGDEPVVIRNMCPQGDQRFALPGLAMGLTIRCDRRPTQRCLAALDTVLLAPSRRQVTLVWRRAIVCRRSADEVLQVVSFAVSLRGARAALGAEADALIKEPAWIS